MIGGEWEIWEPKILTVLKKLENDLTNIKNNFKIYQNELPKSLIVNKSNSEENKLNELKNEVKKINNQIIEIRLDYEKKNKYFIELLNKLNNKITKNEKKNDEIKNILMENRIMYIEMLDKINLNSEKLESAIKSDYFKSRVSNRIWRMYSNGFGSNLTNNNNNNNNNSLDFKELVENSK